MFNLFIIPSKSNEKHLIIEPRQDYYSSGVIKDWTSKLDLSQGITESIISESQSKQILFNMKEDKDYLNTTYKETTQKVYGQYIKNIDNEWLDAKSQQQKILSSEKRILLYQPLLVIWSMKNYLYFLGVKN